MSRNQNIAILGLSQLRILLKWPQMAYLPYLKFRKLKKKIHPWKQNVRFLKPKTSFWCFPIRKTERGFSFGDRTRFFCDQDVLSLDDPNSKLHRKTQKMMAFTSDSNNCTLNRIDYSAYVQTLHFCPPSACIYVETVPLSHTNGIFVFNHITFTRITSSMRSRSLWVSPTTNQNCIVWIAQTYMFEWNINENGRRGAAPRYLISIRAPKYKVLYK